MTTDGQARQNKYLNNLVEQDHRAIKRIIKSMMGFKDFCCARIILSGHRGDAYDQEGTDESGEGNLSVGARAVLLLANVRHPNKISLFCRSFLIATQPCYSENSFY
jgi:hypothetical protein